jgi:hypothetical protein
MALLPSLLNYGQYLLPLRCSHCAAKGKIRWAVSGERKMLVHLSGQFYSRLCKLPPHPIELVCRACGTPQLE